MSIDIILQAVVNGVLNGIIYGLLALGFSMMYGVLNIVNFAHGALVVWSMFLTYSFFNKFNLDPYLSIFIILPLFLLLGLASYFLIFKRIIDKPHSTQIVVTLGLMILLENAANFFYGGNIRSVNTTYSTNNIFLGDISIQTVKVYGAFIALLIIFILYLIIYRTSFGSAIRAASSNYLGAIMVGINIKKVYMFNVLLVFIVTSIVGAVMLPYSYVSPSESGHFLEYAFVITVIGGLGNFNGALLAGILIGIIETLSGAIFKPEFTNAIIFGFLMLVILLKPEGILNKNN